MFDRPLTTRQLAEKYNIPYDKDIHDVVCRKYDDGSTTLIDPYGIHCDFPDTIVICSREVFKKAGYDLSDEAWDRDKAVLSRCYDKLKRVKKFLEICHCITYDRTIAKLWEELTASHINDYSKVKDKIRQVEYFLFKPEGQDFVNIVFDILVRPKDVVHIHCSSRSQGAHRLQIYDNFKLQSTLKWDSYEYDTLLECQIEAIFWFYYEDQENEDVRDGA